MANDNKFVGLMRLTNGDEPKEIAADLGVGYATVIRWKGELKKAADAGTINSLLSMEQGLIEHLASDAVANLPLALQEDAKEAVGELVQGLKGLDKLETSLQQTAMQLNTRLRLMCSTAESIGDVAAITDAVCSLQGAFFGKGTQVNVNTQINASGGENYGAFLGDAPGPK